MGASSRLLHGYRTFTLVLGLPLHVPLEAAARPTYDEIGRLLSRVCGSITMY